MMQKDKVMIAFVCTGNTCRSPMAEGIFNKLADEKKLDVRAESFGISTATGMKVSHNSMLACGEIGVDLSHKTSAEVSDADLEKYSRFFCMSQSHARALSEFFDIPSSEITVLDVPDPYGGNLEIYRQCRDEIYNSVKEIIEAYEN